MKRFRTWLSLVCTMALTGLLGVTFATTAEVATATKAEAVTCSAPWFYNYGNSGRRNPNTYETSPGSSNWYLWIGNPVHASLTRIYVHSGWNIEVWNVDNPGDYVFYSSTGWHTLPSRFTDCNSRTAANEY